MSDRGDGFRPDKNAGVISPRALRSSPGKVRSPRTGRLVAMSTAQLEYGQSIDSVPIKREGMKGGLWSFEAEAEQGPRRAPPRPERYDAEMMARYFEARGNELTVREWELYQLFWGKGMSYAEISRTRGDINRDGVYRAVCRLRVKARRWSHCETPTCHEP